MLAGENCICKTLQNRPYFSIGLTAGIRSKALPSKVAFRIRHIVYCRTEEDSFCNTGTVRGCCSNPKPLSLLGILKDPARNGGSGSCFGSCCFSPAPTPTCFCPCGCCACSFFLLLFSRTLLLLLLLFILTLLQHGLYKAEMISGRVFRIFCCVLGRCLIKRGKRLNINPESLGCAQGSQ